MLPRGCVVCFKELLRFDDGVECLAATESRFVCNGCFCTVQSAIADTTAKEAMREGRIACPYSMFPPVGNSCPADCFADKTVAEEVDEPLFFAREGIPSPVPAARC